MNKALILVLSFLCVLLAAVWAVNPLDPTHNNNILPSNVANNNYTAANSSSDSDYEYSSDSSDDSIPDLVYDSEGEEDAPSEHYSSEDDEPPARNTHFFR